jgi:hypothetical protein
MKIITPKSSGRYIPASAEELAARKANNMRSMGYDPRVPVRAESERERDERHSHDRIFH